MRHLRNKTEEQKTMFRHITLGTVAAIGLTTSTVLAAGGGDQYIEDYAFSFDCTKLLDQQLLQHLPIVNLEDFSVTIERANNESWDSVAQVADHVPVDSAAYDQQLERIMTKTNTFQLVIEMEYGFM